MRMEPPATPPLSSSTSAPGLLTSKDRITIRRGEDMKSRSGMGMRLTMYSFTASILYLSWADMGTIGEDSATVPTTILIVRYGFEVSGVGEAYPSQTPLCSSDAPEPVAL